MTQPNTQTNRQAYLLAVTARYPKSPRMVDFCNKRAFLIIKLEDGSLLPIEKESIKKDFCFGESGYDYEDALASAQHARTSQEYFIEENLKDINSEIERLQDKTHTLMVGKSYDDDSDISYYTIASDGNLLCCPWMFKGMRKATEAEREDLIEAKKFVKEDLKKRVMTYLKKYGMSKVHAWTFWRDA